MSLLKSKKAQSRNYFAVIIFLVVFGFLSMFAYVFFSEFIAAFTAAGLYTGQIQETGDDFLAGIAFYDNVIVMLLAVFILGVGVTSFKLAATKVGFLITFIMAAFWGFVSYFFNFLFQEMISPAVMNAAVLVFPKTIIIATNLHWVMLAMIIVGSIALYGKAEKGQFLA